jgi:hypothetical protein
VVACGVWIKKKCMYGVEFRVWQAFVFGLKLRAADAYTVLFVCAGTESSV